MSSSVPPTVVAEKRAPALEADAVEVLIRPGRDAAVDRVHGRAGEVLRRAGQVAGVAALGGASRWRQCGQRQPDDRCQAEKARR